MIACDTAKTEKRYFENARQDDAKNRKRLFWELYSRLGRQDAGAPREDLRLYVGWELTVIGRCASANPAIFSGKIALPRLAPACRTWDHSHSIIN